MTQKFIPLGIIVIGIMLISIGMMYGVVMVNVPYQDPTPAQSSSSIYHMAIWSRALGIGLCVLGIGVLALIVLTAVYLIQKQLSCPDE